MHFRPVDARSDQLRHLVNIFMALAFLAMSVSVSYMVYRYKYLDPCDACRERAAPCYMSQD